MMLSRTYILRYPSSIFVDHSAGDGRWFSVLDLKKTFFSPASQGMKSLNHYLPLNVRPQKLKPCSKTVGLCCHEDLRIPIFGKISERFRNISLKLGILLQYIYDLLIASNTHEDSLLDTITVLNHLAKRGYKVWPHKASICKQEVAYLKFQLKQCSRKIAENPRQLHEFLGIIGFYQIWIQNFGLIVKPLYFSLKGLHSESLE